MGRRTSTPNRAPTAMKQTQTHVVFLAYGYQIFLRLILRPGRSKGSRIFCRIGVTDHHLLRAYELCSIPIDFKKLIYARRCVLEVIQRFK
ncbi:hypothetical protein D3C85_1479860 [compost metagenome]